MYKRYLPDKEIFFVVYQQMISISVVLNIQSLDSSLLSSLCRMFYCLRNEKKEEEDEREKVDD